MRTRECHLLYRKIATFKTQVNDAGVFLQQCKSRLRKQRGLGEEEDEIHFHNQLLNEDLVELPVLVVFTFISSDISFLLSVKKDGHEHGQVCRSSFEINAKVTRFLNHCLF